MPHGVMVGSGRGDVDLAFGRNALDLDQGEYDQRVADAAATLPPNLDISFAHQIATQRAIEEGLLVWPPPVDFLVAAEVKASWFDQDNDHWKSTKRGSRRRVVRQLTELLQAGFNRVSLLQIGATRPVAGNAFATVGPLIRAERGFPFLFDAPPLHEVGLLGTTLTAVSHELEHNQCAMTPLLPSLPELAGEESGRRVALENSAARRGGWPAWTNALAGLQSPPWSTIFIGWCQSCARLGMHAKPTERTCSSCGKPFWKDRPQPGYGQD